MRVCVPQELIFFGVDRWNGALRTAQLATRERTSAEVCLGSGAALACFVSHFLIPGGPMTPTGQSCSKVRQRFVRFPSPALLRSPRTASRSRQQPLAELTPRNVFVRKGLIARPALVANDAHSIVGNHPTVIDPGNQVFI